MSTATPLARSGSEHLAQFYSSDQELIARLADYVVDGGADVALIVATPAHRDALVRRLAELGGDPLTAQRTGSLVLLDAEATLRRFYDGVAFDPRRFDEVIGDLLGRSVAAGRRIRVYGEMVALLWAEGRISAALELEELWNGLGRRLAFTLLCGYPVGAAEAGAEPIELVCQAHTHVTGRPVATPARTLTRVFAPATTAPAAVRRFVEQTVREWDAAAGLDDLMVIGTELATNAVRYAASDLVVTLTAVGERIRLTVADGSAALPVPGTLDLASASGRGLCIVDLLATSWGYERRPHGKIVWAEIAR